MSANANRTEPRLVWKLKDLEYSIRQIAGETGLSTGTVFNILKEPRE